MTRRTGPTDELRVPELTAGARRIVEVASELFYRQGIHSVGVDTIARESGITKRTLYDRFSSKDTLVAVYLQARHQAWWAQLEQRLADPSPPRVLTVFDVYADSELTSDRGCAFLNAAGELNSDHPGYRVVRAHKRAMRERLTDLVRTDHPNIDEPEMVAEQLFLLLEGAIAHRGIDGDGHLFNTARSLAARLVTQSPYAPADQSIQ